MNYVLTCVCTLTDVSSESRRRRLSGQRTLVALFFSLHRSRETNLREKGIVLKPWQSKQRDFPPPPSCRCLLFKNWFPLSEQTCKADARTQTAAASHVHTHIKITLHPVGLAARPAKKRKTRRAGVMQRQLELAAFVLAITGWMCSVLTRCLALWTVSGTLDNATATLPAYWDGVWLEWDHWDLAHDGSLHCSFYQALMSLSGSFRTWRALIMAAVVAGAFASVIGVVGAVWFPKRGQVKVFSGSLFVVSGILLLVPTAWTCHHTSQPLEGAVMPRRDWGPALYIGWISVALMLAGGAFLITRCPTAERQAEQPDNSRYPGQEEEANHPLSRINRTTFTNSQYQRRSEPI